MKFIKLPEQRSFGTRALLLTSATLLALPLASNTFAEDTTDSDVATSKLDTIKVTGEKIDRSLQETTTAVTVLDESDVDSGELDTANEVVEKVPNMITNPNGTPNIRGALGTGPAAGVYSFTTGARPRVSTTVDGLAESWSGQEYQDTGMWDVEQLEVMRGPQSTTQGRNSIGGAIVLQTKDPTFYWEGAVRAGYEGSENKQQLAAMVSGPLIENELAFRLAANGSMGTGYINYTIPEGDQWPWDPAESEFSNVRGKLLWAPSSIPELTAKLTITRRDQEGEYLNVVNGDHFFDYDFHASFNDEPNNTRYQNTDTTTVSTDVAYEFSDEISLEVLLGTSEYNASFEQYPALFELQLEEESTTFETKLIFTPEDDNNSGVIGIYAYERKQNLDTSTKEFFGDDDVNTLALYGEGRFAMTGTVDLILGGRIEREEQERDVAGWPGLPWGGQVVTDIGETLYLPKIGLDYQWAPNNNLGFTVRKGYTPGAGALDWDNGDFYEYDKEEVVTYEISSRNVLANNTVSIVTNVFYNTLDDLQTLLNNRFVNLPEGKSYGLEMEINAEVARGLNLFGSIGTLQTEITEPDELNPEIKGNEFGYSPDYNLGIGFEQHLDMGIFFGMDANYVSEYYSNADNIEDETAGDYTIVNMHVGYEAASYTVRAYVRNLLDEEVLYRQADGFVPEAQVGPPLTAGIVADYRF